MNLDERKSLFRDLITRHQSQLYGYLFALVHNHDDADDLFQQTSLILWRKFDQFEPESSFISWASRIAYFEAKNFLRSGRPRHVSFSEELLDAFAVNEEQPQDDADGYHDALAGCVTELPEDDRRMIDRTYGDDCSTSEIAEELGRSRQSVANTLRRIRKVLLACIRRKLSQEEQK